MQIEGPTTAGKLRARRSSREIPMLLGGNSRGPMTTGWAMQRNFVDTCTYDLSAVTCAPPMGFSPNIRDAVMIASFGSGGGYLPNAPDLRDRRLSRSRRRGALNDHA